MKLKVFDRVLLAILLIVGILTSFVLFGVAANLITEGMATGFVSLFYAVRQNALILAGCGLVLLLICIKLLFAGKGDKKETRAPASTLMQQNEVGGTYISLDALDAMVKRHCAAQSNIYDCQSTIRPVEDGVTIGIRLSVAPDTDVAALTGQLQNSLKENIQSLTGINVKEIGILVESASVQPPVGQAG